MITISPYLHFFETPKKYNHFTIFCQNFGCAHSTHACSHKSRNSQAKERYKNTRPELSSNLKLSAQNTNTQAVTYKPYRFYSLLSANHQYTAVQTLANSHGLTTTYGTTQFKPSVASEYVQIVVASPPASFQQNIEHDIISIYLTCTHCIFM